MFQLACTLLIALNPFLPWAVVPAHLLARACPASTAGCTRWGAVLTAVVAAEKTRKPSSSKPIDRDASAEDAKDQMEEKEPEQATNAPPHPIKRLPRYFNQLGLNEQQRQQIEKLREKYGARLKRLQDQLDELQQERDEQYRAVLTDRQREKLEELQPSAAE